MAFWHVAQAGLPLWNKIISLSRSPPYFFLTLGHLSFGCCLFRTWQSQVAAEACIYCLQGYIRNLNHNLFFHHYRQGPATARSSSNQESVWYSARGFCNDLNGDIIFCAQPGIISRKWPQALPLDSFRKNRTNMNCSSSSRRILHCSQDRLLALLHGDGNLNPFRKIHQSSSRPHDK